MEASFDLEDLEPLRLHAARLARYSAPDDTHLVRVRDMLERLEAVARRESTTMTVGDVELLYVIGTGLVRSDRRVHPPLGFVLADRRSMDDLGIGILVLHARIARSGLHGARASFLDSP